MPSSIREKYAEVEENLLFLDEAMFDEAIVGLVEGWNGNRIVHRVLYDRDKVLGALMKDGLDEEEAAEYFEFNILDAYVGDYTPLFTALKETT